MLKAIQDQTTYRIVRSIASGGMGAIYEAVQDGASGFQKTVAIKTLLPQLSDDGKFVAMFVQEAKLVADLVHENIVQIYQLGKSGEGYYIVMEFVHGLSLHDFIRFHGLTRQRLPQPLAVFIAARIARGLAYAHSRVDRQGRPLDIVHRDVCPNNILITAEGLPKLADFGIALVSSQGAGGERRSLVGKISYMAPEQANRQNVDFRADLYGLGAVLFELLSGKGIRDGKSEEAITAMACRGEVHWQDLPPDLPPELAQILRRCLAIRPEERYAQTQQLARDLEYFIYKDGYGPTIQTLEAYLRQNFPYLYVPSHVPAQEPTMLTKTRVIEATVIREKTEPGP